MFLVEHTNHVPARLLMLDGMIATLGPVQHDFVRLAIGISYVLHVKDSIAA